MLTLHIPKLSDQTLFEATLEPTAPAMGNLVKRKDMGEGEITTVFGKKNKIAVGVPYFENLISRLIEEEKEIPREIKRMADGYDFHFVSLSCSFLPDDKCKFVWARFGVELNAIAKDSGELHKDKPIAYDMFPDEVVSEIKYKRETRLGPALKFNLGFLDASVNLTDIEQKELIVYEPQIFAYGINRPNLSWDFKSTKEKGVWGNKKDLLLIVRTPKDSIVKGRFLLGAEVEVDIGRLIKIPLTKRQDRVVDIMYDLTKRERAGYTH